MAARLGQCRSVTFPSATRSFSSAFRPNTGRCPWRQFGGGLYAGGEEEKRATPMSVSENAAELGSLPQWDLSDLYPGRDSAELKAALADSDNGAKQFRSRYEGKLAALSGADLAGAIRSYEQLQETLGRIMSYAYLEYCTAMTDAETGRFFQNMQERVNAISTELLFFTLELNRIEDAELQKKLETPALAHYTPWLRD